MKYQSHFSEKNINLLSTEFVHRVVKVKDRYINNLLSYFPAKIHGAVINLYQRHMLGWRKKKS